MRLKRLMRLKPPSRLLSPLFYQDDQILCFPGPPMTPEVAAANMCAVSAVSAVSPFSLPEGRPGALEKVTDAQSRSLCGCSGEHGVLPAEGESMKHLLQKA